MVTLKSLLKKKIPEVRSAYEDAKIKKEYKKAIKNYIKENININYKEIKDEFELAIKQPFFVPDETDQVCVKYNLPSSNFYEIENFLENSYFIKYLEEIIILETLYTIDKNFFNDKEKEKIDNISKISLKYYKFLIIVSSTKNIKSLNVHFLEVKDIAEKLIKLNDLVNK